MIRRNKKKKKKQHMKTKKDVKKIEVRLYFVPSGGGGETQK